MSLTSSRGIRPWLLFPYTIVAMSVIQFPMLSNAFTPLAVPDRFQQTRDTFRRYLTGMVKTIFTDD